jgi:hypothetical protein
MQSPKNPYVGPRAFVENEPLYGRDREAADLRDMLLAERIVLLYSPSGAGKSSLLQVRLIPAMRDRGFTVRKLIRLNSPPPPGATANRYVISMMASLQLEGRPADVQNLTLDRYLDAEPNGELLVFDQFEEILTTDAVNIAAKRDFFEQVGHALRARGRWALFSMREDFVAALDPYLNYIPTRLSSTYRLGLLGYEASLKAIREPAAKVGVKFQDGAAEQIADDLRQVNVPQPDGSVAVQLGQFIEPVQLQVVCLRRWEDLPEGSTAIAKSEQAQIGSTALADYYASTVARVASDSGTPERTIRDWFEHSLVTKIHTRGQVLMGSTETDGLENITVIGELEKAHLLNREERLGSKWLELAHDRLIEPVRSSNKGWRDSHLSPFQQEAEKWNQNGERSPDRVLRGQALEQAEVWAKSNVLTATELEFLKASKRAHGALLLGRVVAALMGILLVMAAAFAIEFYKEKKNYMNALTAGREAARFLVFQTNQKLSQVPNTLAIQKELLENAVNLNQQLGETGKDELGVALTDWYARNTQGKLDDADAKPDEAKAEYEEALVIAKNLIQHQADQKWAQFILWKSYAAIGDLYEKEGNVLSSKADTAKGKDEKEKDEAEADQKWLQASEQFKKALPIAQQLVIREPKDRIWREGLYFLYKGLGETVKDNSEARKYYKDGLDVSLGLAHDYSREDGIFVWENLIALGDLTVDDRDKKSAIAIYQQALLVAEGLANANPMGAEPDSRSRHLKFGHDLWESYMALGDTEQELHTRRNWYEKALAVAKQLDKESQDVTARKATEKRSEGGSGEGQPKHDIADASRALSQLDHGAKK